MNHATEWYVLQQPSWPAPYWHVLRTLEPGRHELFGDGLQYTEAEARNVAEALNTGADAP